MSVSTSDRRIRERNGSARQLNTILESIIDELPEPYRIVVMLRDVEALSTAEIAECLGLSEDAVRSRLQRATAELRDTLLRRAGDSVAQAFRFHDSRSKRVVDNVFEAIRDLRLDRSATALTPQTPRALERVPRPQQEGPATMTEVSIRTLKDGPYEVKGIVHLFDSKNTPFTRSQEPIYLCRCGHSATKPFCDGSHTRIGFRSEEPAR